MANQSNRLGLTNYSREDISDLKDEDIPAEFLVKTPNRRHTDRKECTNDYPCINVLIAENKLAQLSYDFYDFKKDAEAEREKILDELDEIKQILDKQRGFVSGVVWLATGLAGLAGAAFTAFGFFKDNH